MADQLNGAGAASTFTVNGDVEMAGVSTTGRPSPHGSTPRSTASK
ncbi:hypothetical protein ABZ379_26440 [Streptomyces canus]